MTEREALKEIARLLSGHRHKWARAAWRIAVEAQGIEAQRAETTQIGSVADESPVPQGCAQTQSSTPDNKDKPNA